jgi:glycosyltransferase involved in cell wall biosynthesis
MKGLEAWARGLPVAASREAAVQLGATDREDILVADSAEQFARAIVLLAERPDLRRTLVEGARRTLARRFAPAVATAALREAYRLAVRESRRAAVSAVG